MDGSLFRCVCQAGTAWGEGMTEKVVWHVVKEYAGKFGATKLAPHDLRRSCARLCHVAGGELEQIQFLLRHVSVQTTERYLGCKQRIRAAVNGRIGIEPVVTLDTSDHGVQQLAHEATVRGNCLA